MLSVMKNVERKRDYTLSLRKLRTYLKMFLKVIPENVP